MGFNSIRTNIFPERSLGSTRISANSCYLWAPEKQNETFKKINCRSLISKIFILFFLSLIFAFLQNIWNYQNKTSSEVQYRYSNSRKLAEEHSEENNTALDTESKEELLNFNDLTSMLSRYRKEQRSKLNDILKESLDDLFDKARTHEISSEKRNEIWFKFINELYATLRVIDSCIYCTMYNMFRGGPCLREVCNNFLRDNETSWASFLEEVRRIWSEFLQESIELINSDVKLTRFSNIDNS